mgnify:CR=1 FL=1
MPDSKHIRPSELDFGNLRVMAERDLEQVLAWRNHASIRLHMYTQHEITFDEHLSWWNRVSESPNYALFIFERMQRPMGYVAFSEITQKNTTATWGFYTAPDAPKGTGSLMTFAAMEMAFGPLRLPKLDAEILDENTASLQLHKSFGFLSQGLIRNSRLVGDELVSVHRFTLDSDRWKQLRSLKMQLLKKRIFS